MTTSYYRLKKPVTHLRLDEEKGHDKLTIWINHAQSGTLTLANRETQDAIWLFVQQESNDHCPLRTSWGGSDHGAIVTIQDSTLPDETCIISEYGELLTVAKVKARAGAKRKDGMPTELFGYED